MLQREGTRRNGLVAKPRREPRAGKDGHSAIAAALHKTRRDRVVEAAWTCRREQTPSEQPAPQGGEVDALEGRQGARPARRAMHRPLLAHCCPPFWWQVENITRILITRIFAQGFSKNLYFRAILFANIEIFRDRNGRGSLQNIKQG